MGAHYDRRNVRLMSVTLRKHCRTSAQSMVDRKNVVADDAINGQGLSPVDATKWRPNCDSRLDSEV
jgi:hypothetical protein